MSVTCQKEYTVTIVAATPTLDAYWTLDEATGDRIDKVQAIHLSLSSGFDTATSGPGKFSLAMLCGDPAQGSMDFETPSTALLRNQGNGFSIFGWAKVLGSGFGFRPPTLFLTLNNTANQIYMELGFTPDPAIISFSYSDDFNSDTLGVSPAPSLNTWYFFHLFYDAVLGRVGFSINAGAETYFAGTQTFSQVTKGDVQILFSGGAPQEALIDEVGVKMSRRLNAAEITYLYNAGAGRTWPL